MKTLPKYLSQNKVQRALNFDFGIIFEAYALLGNPKCFKQELKQFMTSHMRRKALIKRLVKAGIW